MATGPVFWTSYINLIGTPAVAKEMGDTLTAKLREAGRLNGSSSSRVEVR
jgi:hypothetical protein